ncbi:MAG: GtrA family protein [Clostridia bacterium]
MTDEKKRTLVEFIKYCFVGGTAFVFETLTHFLLNRFILTTESTLNTGISTTSGFVVGLVVNYVLSVLWVFTTQKQQKQGKTVKAFLLFTVIGLIGYGMKLGLMYLGALIFGIDNAVFNQFPIQYYTSHIISAAIVLVWNYIARKIIIFR